MRKLICCILLTLPLWVMAQGGGQADAVKADPNYLWGEGHGATVKEADNNALADLMSKISVQIESDFTIDEREVNTAEGNDAQSTVSNVVRTYSQGTLKNTQNVIVSAEPQAVVVRYIKRSELDKAFKEREELIMSYVYSAMNAEKLGRLDACLRSYYWASCLLKSMPNASSIKMTVDGIKYPLTMWIPEQLRTVMGQIKPEVTKVEDQEVSLLFTYKEKPVTSLDFHYWDGREWSNIYSAKDGMMQVEMMPTTPTDKIHLQYEYEFKGQMRLEAELEKVMHIFKSTPYKEASVTVQTGKKSEQKQAMAAARELARITSSGCITPASVLARMDGRLPSRLLCRCMRSITGKYKPLREEVRLYNKALGEQKKTVRVKGSTIWNYIVTGETKSKKLLRLNDTHPEVEQIIQVCIRLRKMLHDEDDAPTMDEWLKEAEKCQVKQIRGFAEYIRKDKKAVEQACRTCFNNGLLEGTVNKAKAIKRSMFNRANPDVLRAKILYSGMKWGWNYHLN